MKKSPKTGAERKPRVAEIRAEYDFSSGERGKYAQPSAYLGVGRARR